MDLPAAVAEHAAQITAMLRKVSGNLNIRNAEDRRPVAINKQVFLGEEFRQLWDRIKYRTTFRVQFDPERLIDVCAREIQTQLVVGKARFITQTVELQIDRGGVQASEAREGATFYDAHDFELPDIITYLQNETNLTRRTVVEIRRRMRLFIVDGIKYTKIGDEHFYAQEPFESNELYGYLSRNMLESTQSVYDHVVYDSDVEEAFARKFEDSGDVLVYAELPGWFKVDTPLGGYNPDWAVLVQVEGRPQLYFVVETKGNTFLDALRETERAKIDCGRKHFDALGNEARFTMASTYEDFLAKIAE